MSESHNESKSSNKPSFVARHPLLSILGAGVIAGAGVLAGSEYLKTDKEREAIEASREVAEALKAIPAAKAEEARKVGEVVGKAQKAADEAKEGVTRLEDAVRTGDENLATQLREQGDNLGNAIQGIQSAVDTGMQNLGNRTEQAEGRLNVAEAGLREARERLAARRAGITYEHDYYNGFSLTRQPTDNGEVIMLYNPDGRVVRRLDFTKYSDAELEIVHRLDNDADSAFDSTHGGLFIDVDGGEQKATGLATELETVVRLLEEATDRYRNADEIHTATRKAYDGTNTAYNESNTAFQTSDRAFQAANTAFQDAERALQAANTAVENADSASARSDAVAARDAAQAARDTTNTAREEANTAMTAAREKKNAAEQARTEAQTEVDSTRNGRTNSEEDHNKALQRFENIGRNPTYGLIDPKARTLVELFRDVAEEGRYISTTRVIAPGTEVSRPFVAVQQVNPNNYRILTQGTDPTKELVVRKLGRNSAVVDVVTHSAATGTSTRSHKMERSELEGMFDSPAAGKRYSLLSASIDELMSIAIADHPTRRGYKQVTVTRGGHADAYDIPTQYADEMVRAWTDASARGKDSVLAITSGITDINSRITDLVNAATRHQNLEDEYDRGIKWRGTFSEDGENTSNAVRIAGGGEDRDYSADAYQEKTSVTMDNGDATEGSVENLNLDFNFRLGSTPTTAGDTRALFRLSLFGEASSEDSTAAATAPNVNVDGTGRFETTEEYLGGTEGKDSDHVSVGFYSKWNEEEFFRAGIFGGSNRLKWNHVTDVTIRDLSDPSGSGDIFNHVVADGSLTDDYWGLSLTAGIADSAKENALVPVFRLRKGTITENDGTERDYSGLDLGAFYRFVGDDCRLTVGGIWTSGEVDGLEYSEGDLSLHVPFKANDNLVIAPSLGVRLLDSSAEDSAFWRGGIAIGAGGRGTASDTVDAFDRYALDRMLDEMSGQYTPQALAVRDHWRRIGMLQGMDSNLVFGVNANQMYNTEGGHDTGIEAHLALMSQLRGNRRFIFDINYSDNPFGETVGAELGYFGKGNSLSVGYNRVNGKGGMPDDNVIIGSATLRF